VLAGCGGGGSGEENAAKSSATPAASTSPSPTASPASSPTSPSAIPTRPDLPNDPAAGRLVKAGLHGLIEPGTGSYTVDIVFGPGNAVHEEGSYEITPNAYESTRHLVSKEGVVTFAYRAVGDDTWMRLEQAAGVTGEDSNSWPCWAHIGDPQVVADQLGVPLGATGQPPYALTVASYAVGLGFVDVDQATGLGGVLGTTDLALALALLSNQAVAGSGLDPMSKATTLASFTVRKGALIGYSLGFRSMFQAVEAATAAGSIKVGFTDLGKPVQVQAPADNEVVELTADQGAFEDDLRSCGGGDA
jgi:hypothetical protein